MDKNILVSQWFALAWAGRDYIFLTDDKVLMVIGTEH